MFAAFVVFSVDILASLTFVKSGLTDGVLNYNFVVNVNGIRSSEHGGFTHDDTEQSDSLWSVCFMYHSTSTVYVVLELI